MPRKVIRPDQFKPEAVREAEAERKRTKRRAAAQRAREREEAKRKTEERYADFFWRQSEACFDHNWSWCYERKELPFEQVKRYAGDRDPANDNTEKPNA